MLRERRGQSTETVATQSATAADLYDELNRAHGLKLPRAALRVSVNGVISSWDTALAEGDEVAFLPPVSGG